MSLFTKIFGTYSQHQLKKIKAIADRVDALADLYHGLSNADFQEVTPTLKARLAAGETLDDILPDAFAAVREAADRVLGKRQTAFPRANPGRYCTAPGAHCRNEDR